jgi:hypothetical protein
VEKSVGYFADQDGHKGQKEQKNDKIENYFDAHIPTGHRVGRLVCLFEVAFYLFILH